MSYVHEVLAVWPELRPWRLTPVPSWPLSQPWRPARGPYSQDTQTPRPDDASSHTSWPYSPILTHWNRRTNIVRHSAVDTEGHRFCSWRTSVCMELHPPTWGKCWKSMSQHEHWDPHPRTYSASREPTWKPTVTDHLVPVPQNYGISSKIIFGQLGVWQSSNDNWKHICSKMILPNNYVDINIYHLTMNVM